MDFRRFVRISNGSPLVNNFFRVLFIYSRRSCLFRNSYSIIHAGWAKPNVTINCRNGSDFMKKKLVSVILVSCLALLLALPAFGAMSLSNFERVRAYQGDYTDVSPSDWYYNAVLGVYERGIMSGKGAGIFDPSGNLTIAETIALAAKLHKGYHTGDIDFPAGIPWYAPYVEYALANKIPAAAYRNYGAAATRADFAVIIAGALPDEAITPMNKIENGAIPDVYESYSYGQAVYRLYRAGILTGADSSGIYYPGRTLKRYEAAVIIERTVDAGARVPLSLVLELTAEQIYKKASPAVFYIEVFDKDDKLVKTGSGFFIAESGLAVTNYHVVIGASSIKITTDDGVAHDVAGICDYDWKKDIALIQAEGEGYHYLETADSDKVQTGATVYTLGSPLGLQASFTRGIISQSLREIEGAEFIQLDAPISSGSSGGALLDTSCRAIGVTSATMTASQNINLAVPIGFYSELQRETYVPVSSILIPAAYYEGYYPAPDFGAFFGVAVHSMQYSRGGATYSYLVSNLPDAVDIIMDEYTHLVEQNLFDWTSYVIHDGNSFKSYYNALHGVSMIIGLETLNGRDCFSVTLSW